MEQIIEDLGLDYVSECEDFPPYQLDIYIPEWHLDIEVDGPNHTPKHDAERTALLQSRYGIESLHITMKEMALGRAVVDERLLSFFESYADTADERKAVYHEWRVSH